MFPLFFKGFLNPGEPQGSLGIPGDPEGSLGSPREPQGIRLSFPGPMRPWHPSGPRRVSGFKITRGLFCYHFFNCFFAEKKKKTFQPILFLFRAIFFGIFSSKFFWIFFIGTFFVRPSVVRPSVRSGSLTY